MKVDTSFRGHIIFPSQVLEEKAFQNMPATLWFGSVFFQIIPPCKSDCFDLITFDY